MKTLAALFVLAGIASAAQFRNGQAAWAVVGQNGFTTQAYPPSQNIMATPGGLAWANGKLLVSDGNRIGALSSDSSGNPTVGNRVLVFNAVSGFVPDPHSDVANTGNTGNSRCPLCGFAGQLVLGQADFNGIGVGTQTGSVTGMRNPTAVATDGTVVAVADTDNNRVLIWRNFPTANGQSADFVLGQTSLSSVGASNTVNASTLRGPQGVWIQNGKLFVADTQNNRVLIWNSIPSSNNQPADVVLGQANFTTSVAPDPANPSPTAAANQLYSPTSVTSDGTRLYVTDLGFNRVLIWNAIPTAQDQSANIVIGQPDMAGSAANNVPNLCAATGTDSNGKNTYSPRCDRSLSFPRFALSDGTRLFVADGGNDRVLVFNAIPTSNGAAADVVLGQPDMVSDTASDPQLNFASTVISNRAATDSLRTPTSLAWDGTNLYITDPYDLRVMVFTAGDNPVLSPTAVLNAASLAIYQQGAVVISLNAGASITAGDTVTVTIGNSSSGSTPKPYTYTVLKTDTVVTIASGLQQLINANGGDPNVIALPDSVGDLLLTSRQSGLPNATISLSASTSSGASISATASGAYLTGGNAGVIAPGTIVVIDGANLTDGSTAYAPAGATTLPTKLAGAQVYMDGTAAPLIYASPTQIKAQLPFTFGDANSSSIYVRTTPTSGSPQITNATGIIIAQANPGIFTNTGQQLGPATAVHSSNYGTSVVSVDGTAKAGDTGTITIGGKGYTYTVKSGDSLSNIRDGLIAAINSGNDPSVTASAGGQFTRVVLTAKTAGSAGDGISVAATVSSGASLVLTAYTGATCCASTAGAPVTLANPAKPNETISLMTTGLGPLNGITPPTGQAYNGPQPNSVVATVSATIGAGTAQVVNAGIPAGSIGIYQVDLIVPSNASSDPKAQVYIAQNAFISNTATLPLTASGNSLATFTASPNPIITTAQFAQTTLTWSTTAASVVEIHIGSPTGPLMARLGSSGTATTGNWVSDGMTFYLTDPSNPAGPTVLNTVTVRLGTPQSLTTFTASEVDVAPGQNYGSTTLAWSTPLATSVQIRVGSPTGGLLASAGPSGTATAGGWVSAGTTFYLVDVSNSASPTVLASTTPTFKTVLPDFAVDNNPIYAPYSPAGIFGTAQLSWNSPQTPSVEIHVGSPTGPLLTRGPSSGTAQAAGWVANATVFYLVDTSTHAVLNKATAFVELQPENGFLLIQQNPSQGTPGQPESVTLNWSAQNVINTEIHIGSPNGPLLTFAGPQGTANASGWVLDGTTFYLQDVSNGQPRTSQFTIATQTAQFTQSAPGAVFQASPNPIPVEAGTTLGSTTLYWTAPSSVNTVEIHLGSPAGPILARGGATGTATATGWVSDGLVFYLQDVSSGKPLSSQNTLATVTAHLQQFAPGT